MLESCTPMTARFLAVRDRTSLHSLVSTTLLLSMGAFQNFPLLVIALALAISGFLRFMPRAVIDEHLTGHPAQFKPELIPKDIAKELLQMVHDIGDFPSNVDQAAGTSEHIGEGIPINPDGSCSNDYLFPSADKTQCIFPQRVDVAKHYITTGGYDGKKETYRSLISRVSSFARYTFVNNIDDFPSFVKRLFLSDDFQTAAKSICPAGSTHLDPFQYNFIIQIPGQTVPLHLDAPAFWGATRFEYPQWLLVAMVFSNLFKESFINQIQVVGYLHEWEMDPTSGINYGGDFVHYDNSTTTYTVQALPRSGSLLDGTKMIHAAKVYRPDVEVPFLDKDKKCSLKYKGDEKWYIDCMGENIKEYSTNDLRISIVYRARCFKDEEERLRFHHQTPADKMDLNVILGKLTEEMIRKGALTEEASKTISRLDLAFLIMKHFIVYPLPPLENALIPLNYCALPRLVPWTAPIFNLIC